MKTSIELIPVLTKTATVEELEKALEQCRKPFLRKLATVLGRPMAKRKDADANKAFIVKAAEQNLDAVLKEFTKIAERRNTLIKDFNFVAEFVKGRLLQQFLSWLSQGKKPEEAIELAFGDVEESLKEEAEENILKQLA